jgi:hypothetical protein
MREEVRHMQRVTLQARSVRTMLALVAVTASFVTTAFVGGSPYGGTVRAAYFCPPAC